MRIFKSLLFVLILLIFVQQAHSGVPIKTPLIGPNGHTYGFETVDPDLYYLFPDSWRNDSANTFIKNQGGLYYFYFIASPNYKNSLQYFIKGVGYTPGKALLPMPYKSSQTEIYLFSNVGNLVYSVTQDTNNFSAGESIYFKIAFNKSQYEAFSKLARSGLALTGNLTYEYNGEFGATESAIPITVQVDHRLFTTNPDQYELAWLRHALDTTKLYIENALDGFYSLGTYGVNVDDSLLVCDLLSDDYTLERRQAIIAMLPIGDRGNLDCSISFKIREFGYRKSFKVKLISEVHLNLEKLGIEVARMELAKGVVVDDPYYKIVDRMLKDKIIIKKVSEELTRRFRERIFNQNLFFILP